MPRATRSFPVPDSPRINTVMSGSRATRSMCCFSRRISCEPPSTAEKESSAEVGTYRYCRRAGPLRPFAMRVCPRQACKRPASPKRTAGRFMTLAGPVDGDSSEAKRQARVEVGRVGDALDLKGGSLDRVASVEGQRARCERRLPSGSRVGELEVRLGDGLDRRKQLVLAARAGIEDAPRRHLAKRERGQFDQGLRVSTRAFELGGVNHVPEYRGPFGERPRPRPTMTHANLLRRPTPTNERGPGWQNDTRLVDQNGDG